MRELGFSRVDNIDKSIDGYMRQLDTADRGYFKSEEIKACDDAGIITYLPESITSSGRKAGRFTQQEFRNLPDTNEYLSPSRERLQWHFTTNERGMGLHCYWSFAACVVRVQSNSNAQHQLSRVE